MDSGNILMIKVMSELDEALSKSSALPLNRGTTAKQLKFDDDESTFIDSRKRQLCAVGGGFNKLRCLDGELVTSRSTILKLEERITELETENRLAKIAFDQKIEEVKAEQWREKEAFEEMRYKAQQVIAKNVSRKTEYADFKKEISAKVKNYENKIKTLEKEKDDIRNELNEQVTDSSETIFQLESKLQRECMEKDTLQKDLELAQAQLQNYEQKSVDVVEQMQAAEEARMRVTEVERQVKTLELELSKQSDYGKLAKIFQNQLSKLPELEKEIWLLKEENRVHRMRDENIMLLREQLTSTKSSLEVTELHCAELPKVQLENDNLKQKLSEWDKCLAIVNLVEAKSPHSVAKEISRLQQQETVLLEKVGTLTSSNHSLQSTQTSLENQVQKLKDSHQKCQKLVEQNSERVRHLQRKLALVSKERDFFRELLENYEKETTVVTAAQQDDKVQRLEALVHGYKKSMENLEMELESCRKQLNKFGHVSCTEIEVERTKLEHELKDLKLKISKSDDKVRQLTEDKMSLELQLEYYTLKGEINPFKTRVLHLSSNPASWHKQQRVDELDLCRKENEILRQRIKIIEEAGGKVEDLTMLVGEKLKEAPSIKDVEAIKEQMHSAELKNKRLKEAFQRISTDFHEVAYTLLGYKLDMLSNKFQLSSMYAESAEDCLVFQKSENGEFSLLQTPFSAQLEQKIHLFLHTYHSIPAFLSSVTLDLFNSQTALQSTSVDVTNN